MKKIILALVALASTAFASNAQSLYNNPDNHSFFGARLGVDITSTSGDDDFYNNGAGFTLGAIYNIPVWQNLYFEPGLAIFYDTFGTEMVVPDAGGLHYDLVDGTIKNFGFRIPLLFGYNFDFTDDIRLAPFTGPQVNINLTAKQSWDNDALKNSEGSIFGEGGFKRVDLQWVFGLGLTYQKYYVSLSGGIGMTKVLSLKTENFRRNTVNIAVGYNF